MIGLIVATILLILLWIPLLVIMIWGHSPKTKITWERDNGKFVKGGRSENTYYRIGQSSIALSFESSSMIAGIAGLAYIVFLYYR
jgi:hypothetical protein